MAKVDIIIPAYNAALTIEDTLRSVMEQTALPDCRVIVVDDGSTDATPDVVNAFLLDHYHFAERCSVISLGRNEGCAEAYNIGVNAGHSEWIARCDADDCMMPYSIERLLSLGEKSGADIVAGSMTIEEDGKRKVLAPVIDKGLRSMPLDTVNFSLCNKLIRRTLLLRAPDGRPVSVLPGINCWDDLSMLSRLLAIPGCTTATLGGDPVYLYRRGKNAESLTRSERVYILKQHIMCARALAKWFEANDLDGLNREFIERLKFLSKVKLLQGSGAISRIGQWRKIFPETSRYIMSMKPDLNLPMRAIFRLLSL